MDREMMIISVDGVSGTGKSQIMRWLMGWYRDSGARVMGFSENLVGPERGGLGEEITRIRARSDLGLEERERRVDRTFTQMAAKDRAYLSRTFVPFARQAATDMLFMDRWLATNMAYQSLHDLSSVEILEMHRELEVIEPHLYIILTCPVEIAFERVTQRTTKVVRNLSGQMSTVRGADGKVNRDASLRKMAAIQDRFLELPVILGEGKCLVIDTDRPLLELMSLLVGGIEHFGSGYANEEAVPAMMRILRHERLLEKAGEINPFPYDHQVISG